MRIVLVLAILVAGGGFYLWQGGAATMGTGVESATGGTYTVQQGDLVISLTERGTLSTRNAAQVSSQVERRVPIKWLIEEGSTVSTGEVVVEFDSSELAQEVENRQNLIIQLESEEKAALTEEQIQIEQNQTDVEKAQLQLEVARAELAKLMEGDIPAKERELELAITTADSEFERAKARFQEMPKMLEKEFITADQFEDERIKKFKAEESLRTARQNKDLYLKYQKPLDIRQKEAAVTEAERGILRATNQAEARLEGKKAQVNQKQRRLARERQELLVDLADLEKMSLDAPADGVVLYGDPDRSWDSEDIRVGNNVYQGQIIVTIPDPTEMAVQINVHEADIDKLRVGMPATIRSETKKGKSFNGEVAKIDSVANAGNRRWGDQIRRFKVEIQLGGQELDLKPGTSASVDIRIGEMNDVIYVPLQAVHSRQGRFFCYQRKDGLVVESRVRVGRSNESYLEILEGLSPGDEILLYEPDAAQVESAGASGREEQAAPTTERRRPEGGVGGRRGGRPPGGAGAGGSGGSGAGGPRGRPQP
ncbi:MAG: efflux RND transporter periplasmic adaptor subunit [Planctomycetota bacterium]